MPRRVLRAAFLTIICGFLLLSNGGSHAQSGVNVPAASWYALVYAPTTDTLHWITPGGQILAMPRPQLPDEADFGFPEMHLSADGRRLVISRPTPNNTFQIGFYAVETGEFIQIHESQAGEIPYVFSRYASDADSGAVAIGLANGINADEAAWRVILFDFESGSVIAQLSSSDEALNNLENGPTLATARVFPQVMWVESGSGLSAAIHVRLDPISLDDADRPSDALIWYPSGINGDPANTVATSPYTAKAIDFVVGDTDAAFAYYNGALPRTDVPFINANAIGRGGVRPIAGYRPPALLFGTGVEAYDRVLWAGDQRGVIFRGNQADGSFRWYVLDFNSGQPVALPTGTVDAMGIPTGFLYASDGVVYSRAVPNTGTGELPVWDSELGEGAPLLFVWATPIGSLNNFAVGSIFAPEGSDTTVQVAGTRYCDDGLPSRVAVGDSVELLLPYGIFATEDEAQVPEAEVFVRLEAATAMTIIGGPVCVNDFTYWQVQLSDGRRGYTVESGETDYVLGLEGTGPSLPSDPSGETAVDPIAGQDTTVVVGPDALLDCPNALEAQLEVGAEAVTTTLAAMYEAEDPNAIGNADVYRGVPPQQSVTVVGGPVCANGYLYWIVDWRDQADALHRGWIAESIETGYIIAPPGADVPVPQDSTVLEPSPTVEPPPTIEPTPVVTPPTEEVIHCEGAPPSVVVVGLQARIDTLNDIPVFIRDAPAGNQIDLIDSGEIITIIGGPECAEGNPFTYWQIRSSDGLVEGWMAEGDVIGYFLTTDLDGEE